MSGNQIEEDEIRGAADLNSRLSCPDLVHPVPLQPQAPNQGFSVVGVLLHDQYAPGHRETRLP
jgi:hypothetical protein